MRMSLKRPFLAAENSAMQRRQRALYRFLAGSPLALLLAVAAVGHFPHPPYPHPAGNADYNARVLAYRDVVAASQELRRARAPSADGLVRLAHEWVDGYAAGRLSPIESAVFEDHFRDGARGEIVRAALDLATTLSLRASRSQESGQAQTAAEQAVLAAETAFGVRGFDLQSHLQSLLAVRRCLLILELVWPRLDPEAKEALRPRLRRMVVAPGEIDALATREQTQLDEYLRRQKIPASSLGSPELRFIEGPNTEERAAAKRGAQFSNARIEAFLRKGEEARGKG